MKKFKKLIPALCMLLASAILLGGSTYAWFSMNNEVTAKGMNVSATTNTQFLIISNQAGDITNTTTPSSNTEVNPIAKTSGGIGGDTNNVFPCARVKDIPVGTTTPAALTGKKWYTANSKVMTSEGAVGSANFTNAKAVDDKLTDYVLTYTCYIGLGKGSTRYNGDLTVTATPTNLANGVTAIVTFGETTDAPEIKFEGTTTTGTFANVTLKANEAVKVTVQLYIDGNNAAVKTQGFTSLTGTLDLKFAINPTV